ncbi:Predicted dehydrogenase and related protein [Candidatus Terasakiella magnetica]|nr:Predicted dehydrogenase and related protein [Candidatus Terasakiella magnetica]
MINVGVIGFGYWGPNLVRNFSASGRTNMVAVCDLDPKRLAVAARSYPAIRTTTDVKELLAAGDIDAVAISTPVQHHFELAMAALKAGKHVLVEKPMASTAEECRLLIEEAARRKLTLMVDHTFIYTPAVQKMRDLVQSGELGEVYYYDSVRVNLGLFQHDVNVLWDLAVHDLSIIEYVLGQVPVAVSATGISHVPGAPENIAYMTLFFDSSTIAHVNVNWLAPVKVRQTLVSGSKKMVVFNELEPSEKIKVYDKGIVLNDDQEQINKLIAGYRTGDMWAPQLAGTEALAAEVSHFADCIENGTTPLTDGVMGFNVVKVLEAASRSLAERGASMPVER